MSYPQAQRRKQAKTKPPTHYLAATVKPARLQHGRRGRATSRKRWNDAVGTSLAHGPETKNEPPSHMAAIHRFRCRTASAGSCKGPPWRYHTKAFPWVAGHAKVSHGRAKPTHGRAVEAVSGRRIHAMAASKSPPESNKGVSERLSAPGGKSTRVRRESPSKTPKNDF